MASDVCFDLMMTWKVTNTW